MNNEESRRTTLEYAGTAHVVLLGAILILALLSAFGVWDLKHTESAWAHLGVRTVEQKQTFGDLRTVLGAVDCERRGADVYVSNPCGPDGWPTNHPPIWLLLDRTGLGLWATNWIGLAMAAAFVAGLVLLFVEVRLCWAWLALATAFSPMSLLLIERGNTDSIVWVLLLAAALAMAQKTGWRAMAGGLIVGFATALKFFPLSFAFANALRRNKAWEARYVGFGFSTLAVLVEAPWIRHAIDNTSYGSSLSYGREVAFYALLNPGRFQAAAAITAVALAVLVASLLSRSRVRWPTLTDNPHSLLYLAGAAIYVGTFLLLRANWGYRTVFLIFCIPFLCAELDRGEVPTRVPTISIVVCIVGLMWTLGSTTPALIASMTFSWVLFVILSAHLFASLARRGG